MSDEILKSILLLPYNPSCKLTLLTLGIYNKPMTTQDLNNALGMHKTLQNYEFMFEDLISRGIIKEYSMKTFYGSMRKHFEISLDALKEEISE